MSGCKRPCKSCPWVIENTAAEIPGFSLTLAEALDETTDTGLGAPIMACHLAHEGGEVPCAGWLARHGWDSIAVRFRLLRGETDRAQLEPGADWPPTHESFDEMIEKLRRTA